MDIDLEKITAELDLYKQEKARLSFELKNIEKEIQKRELQLVTILSKLEVESMDYGVYSFGWKVTKRKTFDQKLFKKEHPDVFNKYYIEKENKNFEFKISK